MSTTPLNEPELAEAVNGTDTLHLDEVQFLTDLVAKGAMHKAFLERVLARQSTPQTHVGLGDDAIRRSGNRII